MIPNGRRQFDRIMGVSKSRNAVFGRRVPRLLLSMIRSEKSAIFRDRVQDIDVRVLPTDDFTFAQVQTGDE